MTILIAFLLIGVALSFPVASYEQSKGYSFGLALIGCVFVSPVVVLTGEYAE